MNHAQNVSTALLRSFRSAPLKTILGTVLLLAILILAACGSGPTNAPTSTAATLTSIASNTSTNQQTTTSAPGSSTTAVSTGSTATSSNGYPVKVYFSKTPDSLNNFNAVFPVDRTSPTTAVATFALQLLIAGPTLSERSSGYFSEFNSILTGPSSCSSPSNPTGGGPDFTVTLDMKGPKPEKGTATVQFCRATNSPGVGADARILAEINATLKQFSNIKKVVVLTQAGQCFGDESGQNMCLK